MKRFVLIAEGFIFIVTSYLLLSFLSAAVQGAKGGVGGDWLLVLWFFGVAPIAFLLFVALTMKAQWRAGKADYWLFLAVLLACAMTFNAWGMHSFVFKAAASSLGSAVVMLLGFVRLRKVCATRAAPKSAGIEPS